MYKVYRLSCMYMHVSNMYNCELRKNWHFLAKKNKNKQTLQRTHACTYRTIHTLCTCIIVTYGKFGIFGEKRYKRNSLPTDTYM